MSDPIPALSKFTPAAANRDDLLFAAGRASARIPARWKWLAGLLTVTQTATLALWLWPKPEPATVEVPVPPTAVVPEADPVPPPTPPDPHSYLALMHRDGDAEPRERFVPDDPRPARPLTAGSRTFD